MCGATGYTVPASDAEKKKSENYQRDFLILNFIYQLLHGEEHSHCVVCDEGLTGSCFNAINLCRQLTTKHESPTNKALQFFVN
jgi:hypothetical protein